MERRVVPRGPGCCAFSSMLDALLDVRPAAGDGGKVLSPVRGGRAKGAGKAFLFTVAVVAASVFTKASTVRAALAGLPPAGQLLDLGKESVQMMRRGEGWDVAAPVDPTSVARREGAGGPQRTGQACPLPCAFHAAAPAAAPAAPAAGSGPSGTAGGGGGVDRVCPVPGCDWEPTGNTKTYAKMVWHFKRDHKEAGPLHLYEPPVEGDECQQCEEGEAAHSTEEWAERIFDASLEEYSDLQYVAFESQATVQRFKDASKAVNATACLPPPPNQPSTPHTNPISLRVGA